jgi:hypothetical protein
VAVNVTDVPAQIVVVEALIETAGVTGVVTVIVMMLLVAVGEVTHVTLLVRTQLTVFPFANALSE